MAATDDGGSDTAADDGRCKCAMKKEDHQSTCLQCHRQSLNSSLLSSSLSCYFLSFDSHPVQYYDKLRRVYRASVKAFSIGAGLKGGLALFSFLSRLRRGRSLPFSKYAFMTPVYIFYFILILVGPVYIFLFCMNCFVSKSIHAGACLCMQCFCVHSLSFSCN